MLPRPARMSPWRTEGSNSARRDVSHKISSHGCILMPPGLGIISCAIRESSRDAPRSWALIRGREKTTQGFSMARSLRGADASMRDRAYRRPSGCPISATVVGLLSSPVLIACDPARRRREQPAGIWSHRSRGLLELNGPARYQISV